jgi:hypothetical protein
MTAAERELARAVVVADGFRVFGDLSPSVAIRAATALFRATHDRLPTAKGDAR